MPEALPFNGVALVSKNESAPSQVGTSPDMTSDAVRMEDPFNLF